MIASRNNLLLYRRLWKQAAPYWRYLLAIFCLSLLSPPLALLTPLPLKIAVDSVIGNRPLPSFLDFLLPEYLKTSQMALLLFVTALMIGVTLLTQARDYANSLLTTYAGEKMLRGFRAQLFRHVQRLSLAYHDTKGTADSTYRIQYDASSVQNITVEGVVPFMTSSLTLVSMIYVTTRINWQFALVALAVSPVLYLVSRTYRQKLRSQSREVKKIESSALSVVQEVLGAARVVKAFCQEDREEERFVSRSNEGMQARIRLAFAEGGFAMLVALIMALGTAAVLYIGVKEIKSGALTLGELLLVMGYLSQLYVPLKNMSKKMASMQNYLASAERAFALLDESPDVVEKPDAFRISRARGAMSFRDVSFGYQENHPVLRHLSFDIEPGTCVGISGVTGTGKTTLVNLLTRFYDPTGGRILLDGVDLRDYKVADLRNQFAMVLQEPVLFSTSIGENIAYARPDATREEIIAAAKAANAHEFVTRLPEGYETPVGERGMRLSGGERQRISIARAFLKDAPMLLLDEPTGSVDVSTEAAIVDAMERLTRGRTTFIIAHRPGTLSHCKLVLRLEEGYVRVLEGVSYLDIEALLMPTQTGRREVNKAHV
jgi:ATP-binding cassette subfamily B protein